MRLVQFQRPTHDLVLDIVRQGRIECGERDAEDQFKGEGRPEVRRAMSEFVARHHTAGSKPDEIGDLLLTEGPLFAVTPQRLACCIGKDRLGFDPAGLASSFRGRRDCASGRSVAEATAVH